MPDFTSQRCAAYKVGMEQQSLCLGLVFQLNFYYLPRREAGYSPFLIVVGLASITDIATTGLFQEQGMSP